MTAYQQGDAQAFAELVARHEKPLWCFLRRSTHDDAAAEDLLQETFMRVIHGASGWRPEAKFSSWLYTIARNLCIDHARKQKHGRPISLDGPRQRDRQSAPPLREQLPGQDIGAERIAQNRELAGRLEQAIAGLPDAQREVFLMREALELPFAEIAQVIGVSEPTVKSRMRYALERLRSVLAEPTSEAPRVEVES